MLCFSHPVKRGFLFTPSDHYVQRPKEASSRIVIIPASQKTLSSSVPTLHEHGVPHRQQ